MRSLLVLALSLGISLMAAHAPAQEAGLLAGAARVSITPAFPTPMGGYFDRLGNFEGVNTPVHARALVARSGDSTQALVSMELIGVSRQLVDLVRAAIAEATGLSAEHIMIAATHNHSAPSGFAGMSLAGESDEHKDLTAFLVAQSVAVVQQALDALTPATLGYGAGLVEGATRNRQQNNTEVIDPELGVLLVRAQDTGEVIATVCHFTGHPVILGGNNLDISSEYPGRVAQVVEDVLGGTALFVQGACGDVTMIRSGDPFTEIIRLGNMVAGEALKTAGLIQQSAETRLLSVFQPVRLEAREVPSLAAAESQLEAAEQAAQAAKDADQPAAAQRRLQGQADAARNLRNVARILERRPDLLEHSANASVHVMQWGPLVMAGIPGELFVEYQLEMKQRVRQSLGRPFMLAGYANGYIGYIVTPRAAQTGGYEWGVSRVSPAAGRTLVESALQIAEDQIPALE